MVSKFFFFFEFNNEERKINILFSITIMQNRVMIYIYIYTK